MLMPVVIEDFVLWLNKELGTRGWSQSELARRAGIHQVTISRILNGERNPGEDFCRAIANALGLPAVDVFKLAGLLPASNVPEGDKIANKLRELVDLLSAEHRLTLFEIASGFYAAEQAGDQAAAQSRPAKGDGQRGSKKPSKRNSEKRMRGAES